jgi:hypothetical protein
VRRAQPDFGQRFEPSALVIGRRRRVLQTDLVYCLDTMVLVKPATVVQWHGQGFRLFWHWRSRSRPPPVDREVRKLVSEMSSANPLWGAPRNHGELFKLSIEISRATVAKNMVRRRGSSSPSWRSFLRNQAQGIAAIDMFRPGLRVVLAGLGYGHPRP